MRRRAAILAAAVVLALAGGWQVGYGLYMDAKAALAQHLLSRSWDAARDGTQQARPWPWADTWPMARLRVPALGVDQIILAGGSGSTLAFGPGHVDGTAPPGTNGVSVVGGHRDTHFAFLRDLAPGMSLLVERPDGATATYVVADAAVMHKDRIRLQVPDLAPLLVLSTCWPFDGIVAGGPMRYVVTATGDGRVRPSLTEL